MKAFLLALALNLSNDEAEANVRSCQPFSQALLQCVRVTISDILHKGWSAEMSL